MTLEKLHGMELLAEAEPLPVLKSEYRQHHSSDRPWPSYEITLSRTRPKRDGSGPDRSLPDHNWAMICCTGGKSIGDTTAKLLEVSRNAQERYQRGDEGYARITVENATAAVVRNYSRNRA